MPFKDLTDFDFDQAADEIGCDVAAIKAVCEVEAPKGAFTAPGQATILFEAHIFSKYTKGRFDDSHPDLSSHGWNTKLYKGGAAEWGRYLRATHLDLEAARMAISMGAFQIMGFNFAHCGFRSVLEFFEAHNLNEAAQLAAFVEFVKSRRLDDELRERRWADFARQYNGPRFADNRYDEKLARAYAKAAGDPPQIRPPAPAPAAIVPSPPPAATEPAAHQSDSKKSVQAGVGASGLIAALTGAGQWLKGDTAKVAIIAVTILAAMFIFRQAILAAIREHAKWRQ